MRSVPLITAPKGSEQGSSVDAEESTRRSLPLAEDRKQPCLDARKLWERIGKPHGAFRKWADHYIKPLLERQEPATEPRLRQVLRRAGVSGAEIVKSVGLSPEGFNSANPNLPLWAAVALVLESTGRFHPQGTRAEHSR